MIASCVTADLPPRCPAGHWGRNRCSPVRWRMFFALVGLCLVFCLAACTREEAPARAPHIGILIYSGADPFLSKVAANVAKLTKSAAKVTLLDAQNSQPRQEEQLLRLLREGVDVLVLNMVEPHRASFVMGKIAPHKIPVVLFNREPDLDDLTFSDKICYVGTEPRQAGKLQGEIIHQLWNSLPHMDRNKDKVLQFILLQGNADNPEALGRSEYSVRKARELGVPMRQIGNNYTCNWDRELAEESMRIVMATEANTVEMILSNNDVMALGALQVLAEYGFNTKPDGPFIPVIGVDAIDEALTAIAQGRMSGTVRQNGQAMAEAVAAIAINALKNKDFLENTSYQWDASGMAVRIPYTKVH